MYSEIEQQTLDIDWFVTDSENVGFVASAGGKLPETILELGDQNGMLSNYFRNLSEISEAVINPRLNEILQTPTDKAYLSDFVNMAKKGLYSFDKKVLNNFSDPHYHLVASPKKPLKLKDLPQDVLDILLKTQSLNSLETAQKINVLEIN